MTAADILPASSAAASLGFILAAFALAYAAQRAHTCTRTALYAAASAGSTLAAAGLLFGNILAILLCR